MKTEFLGIVQVSEVSLLYRWLFATMQGIYGSSSLEAAFTVESKGGPWAILVVLNVLNFVFLWWISHLKGALNRCQKK